MTPWELRDWMRRLELNKTEAADALGIARNSFHAYIEGRRPVPKYIGLACAAIAQGIEEYPIVS